MKTDITIKNVEDKYLYSIIDNQRIDYLLQKIEKEKTEIRGNSFINMYFNTSLELEYNIKRFHCLLKKRITQPKNDENFNDDRELSFILNSDINIYNEISQVFPLEKGIVKLYKKHNQKLKLIDVIEIEKDGIIKKELELDWEIGKYELILIYEGNKYYEPCSFPILLNITKRDVIIKTDKDLYYGNPDEELNLFLDFVDNLGKPISNTTFSYEFENKKFYTATNRAGECVIQIKVPRKIQENCIDGYKERYPLYIGFDDNSFYNSPLESVIYIYTNKLDTIINISDIDIVKNNLLLNGNVIAKNYDKIEDVEYGEIDVYINDFLLDTIEVKEEGRYSAYLDYSGVFNNQTNNSTSNIPYNSIVPIQTSVFFDFKGTIESETEPKVFVNDEVEIFCQITTKSSATTKGEPISDGMVKFIISNKYGEVERYITETDKQGKAFGYFNATKDGNYTIQAKYYGFFEYQDSESEPIEFEVIKK